MASPTTAVVTWDGFQNFFGDDVASVQIRTEPVLGGATHLTHVESGLALVPIEALTQGDASWEVYHTDQPGFVDGAGQAFTGWSYRSTALVTAHSGDSVTLTKVYQPVVGQATIDLNEVPDGSVGAPSSSPTATVTSVDGDTGAINLAATYVQAVTNGDDVTLYLDGVEL